MLHVTCDLCGKDLRPGDDRRYVVKIEVFAAHDVNALREGDLDEDDPMEALHDLLSGEQAPGDDNPTPERSQFRYDLCPSCRKRFARDPLCREAPAQLHFSEN